MKPDDTVAEEEQVLSWLSACDAALAEGTVPPAPDDGTPPPELRQRLEEGLACLQLLEQV
jgi:hypothetical protein